jgi:N utilization substance protein B
MNDARSAARFAAVQALYQMELTGADSATVTEEFLTHRFGHDDIVPGEPDEEFFAAILNGTPAHQAEIDAAIADCLAEGWRLKRVDSILRAILRAGAFELIARPEVPAKVVIDEYVELAHTFFSADEAAFANAALDRLARVKRAAEFG